jgi:hypothetical protein
LYNAHEFYVQHKLLKMKIDVMLMVNVKRTECSYAY